MNRRDFFGSIARGVATAAAMAYCPKVLEPVRVGAQVPNPAPAMTYWMQEGAHGLRAGSFVALDDHGRAVPFNGDRPFLGIVHSCTEDWVSIQVRSEP